MNVAATLLRAACATRATRPTNVLSELWECRRVEHMDAYTDKLRYQESTPHRFDYGFTKLRALQLTVFENVLTLESTIVTSCVDDLFKLIAPDALRRSMNVAATLLRAACATRATRPMNVLSELWECRRVEHIDAYTDELICQDSNPTALTTCSLSRGRRSSQSL